MADYEWMHTNTRSKAIYTQIMDMIKTKMKKIDIHDD